MSMTLLLNASYEPLSVISWQRALTMFFLGKVEVVAEYEDREVRSVSMSVRIPSVVRLLKYTRKRYLTVKFSRQNIYARDGYRCQYCGRHATDAELSLDHILPRSLGGRACWENIVACCIHCNRKKGSKTPEQAGMKLLDRPYKPHSLAQLTIRIHRVQPPVHWLEYFD